MTWTLSLFPLATFVNLCIVLCSDGKLLFSCIFPWYRNIVEAYISILLTISQCKWILRFFSEWLYMHKQSIQDSFSSHVARVRGYKHVVSEPDPLIQRKRGLVNLHWVWLQRLTWLWKHKLQKEWGGKIIRFIGGKINCGFPLHSLLVARLL